MLSSWYARFPCLPFLTACVCVCAWVRLYRLGVVIFVWSAFVCLCIRFSVPLCHEQAGACARLPVQVRVGYISCTHVPLFRLRAPLVLRFPPLFHFSLLPLPLPVALEACRCVAYSVSCASALSFSSSPFALASASLCFVCRAVLWKDLSIRRLPAFSSTRYSLHVCVCVCARLFVCMHVVVVSSPMPPWLHTVTITVWWTSLSSPHFFRVFFFAIMKKKFFFPFRDAVIPCLAPFPLSPSPCLCPLPFPLSISPSLARLFIAVSDIKGGRRQPLFMTPDKPSKSPRCAPSLLSPSLSLS